MLASPGCWAAYTGLLGSSLAGMDLPSPHGSLTFDAYAVQHPGTPNPQATQSVWVHLIALHLVLERGWPAAQLVRIRRLGAEAPHTWSWLVPPPSMGAVTAIDVATASRTDAAEAVRGWVEGSWAAWAMHHRLVAEVAERLVASSG